MKKDMSIKHILLTGLPFLVLGILFLILPVDHLILGGVDELTDKYMTELSVKAGSAFGIARVLNSLISVAQSFSIDILASVNIGAALSPLNDLVEKFSNVMLLSLTSIGIQIIIFHIGQAIGIRWFLSLALISYSFVRICKFLSVNEFADKRTLELMTNIFIFVCKTLLLFFFIIRLFIPLIVLVGKTTEPFVLDKYNKANKEISEITKNSQSEIGIFNDDEQNISEKILQDDDLDQNKIDNEQEEKQLENKNIFMRMFNFKSFTNLSKQISEAAGSKNIKRGINNLINSISDIIPYVIDLIIVFILQTVIIPIAVLFFMRYFLWFIIKNIFDKSLF